GGRPRTGFKALARFDTDWGLFASADYLARKGAPSEINELAGHDLIDAQLMSHGEAGFAHIF
ncbi:MAG: hypothetical protein AAGF86_04725, partial [Pseudomonadota bacterium]